MVHGNMNTLQHGFWIYVATRKLDRCWHYVLGAVFPDLIYFVGLLYLLLSGQIPWQEYAFWIHPVVGISYLRSLPWVGWVEFTGHSAIIWLGILCLSIILPVPKVRAFALGWGAHLGLDFFTHVQYAPYLLYPFSWRQFPIGVSYWDYSYHGKEFQRVQDALTILAVIYLLFRYWLNRRTLK